MDLFLSFVRAVFSLILVLGLFGLGVYAFRRWGPSGLLKFTAQADRRLRVVETLSLGAQQRLVLVKLDACEHLILLGEGRVIEATPSAVKL